MEEDNIFLAEIPRLYYNKGIVTKKEERAVWILLFLLVLSAVLIDLLAVSYRVCRPLLMPESRGEEVSPLTEQMLRSGRPFEVRTTDGCVMSALWLEAPEASSRAVIFVHDAGGGKASMADRAAFFLEQGYHVILYDQGRKPSTCGVRERKDLRLLCTVIFRQMGEGSQIGTLGVGAGAVTALLHACLDSRISFVIADTAADPEEVLRRRLNLEYRMPSFPILQAASVLCRIWGGFSFRDVSARQELQRRAGLIAVPVLFIHGEQDQEIPVEMAVKLFEAKQGAKELYLSPRAGHTKAWEADPAEYERRVGEFLRKNLQEKRAAV